MKLATVDRIAASATGAAACSAILLTVLRWPMPASFDAGAMGLALLCLLTVLGGLATIIASLIGHVGWMRSESARGRGAPGVLSRLPRRGRVLLLGLGVLSGLSAALGLYRTGGFSQGSDHADCRWAISKNHDITVLCVSHERWLQVGRDAETGLLGILAVIALAETAVLVSVAQFGGESEDGEGMPSPS